MTRRILFTRPAEQDIAWLRDHGFTVSDWQRLKANLKRVAGLDDVTDDEYVCELRMCRKYTPKWFRLKQRQLRSASESGLRVIFEIDDQTMTIWCILARTDNTYEIVEARLRAV